MSKLIKLSDLHYLHAGMINHVSIHKANVIVKFGVDGRIDIPCDSDDEAKLVAVRIVDDTNFVMTPEAVYGALAAAAPPAAPEATEPSRDPAAKDKDKSPKK